MTFQIKANPTFPASLTIVGQGREQKLNVVFRHKTRTEYADLLKSLADGELDAAGLVLALLESWDADAPLDQSGLDLLQEHQPGADFAIISAYGEALAVARKKN